jgi:hypothetical protein
MIFGFLKKLKEFYQKTPKISFVTGLFKKQLVTRKYCMKQNFTSSSLSCTCLCLVLHGNSCIYIKELPLQQNARDAIRTHEPLQEWILSPSELAGLSYPRTGTWY